jgi:phosphate butyryltransferase
MTLRDFQHLTDLVRGRTRGGRVAVVEAQDMHTLEAVLAAHDQGLADPLLLGRAPEVAAALICLGRDPLEFRIVEAGSPVDSSRKAVALVRAGEADSILKGAVQTADLLRAVVDRDAGLRLEGRIMSHVVLNEVPGIPRLLVTTDGGMNPNPDLLQKKGILENAVEVLRRLGYASPRVAVLSAAEVVNEKIASSLEAEELKRMNQAGEIRDCRVEGPISFDLAVSSASAREKGYNSEVAGAADILLAPDMTAGNILGKALVYAAGARMAGLVVGASAPIVLTSRGSSADEKFLSLVLSAAFAAGEPA